MNKEDMKKLAGMGKVYYAHTCYKYPEDPNKGPSEIEAYEMRVCRKFLPTAEIINPSTFPQDYPGLNADEREREIMKVCINNLLSSDAVVFSTLEGIVGAGCYEEIVTALSANIPLYYIDKHTLTRVKKFKTKIIEDSDTRREFAIIYINR